jgi:hypothetical protein
MVAYRGDAVVVTGSAVLGLCVFAFTLVAAGSIVGQVIIRKVRS